MRLVTYDAGAGPRAGALSEDHVLPLLADSGATPGDVGAVLAAGGVEAFAVGDDGTALDEVTLLPPIARPGKIVCIGLNYRSHAEEQGAEPPTVPTFFAKFANALWAPGSELPLPVKGDKVDYEAEVAFAIGTRCRRVPESGALDHVAGYMLLNDLSARDLQFETPQWMPGKVFDGAAPCGPALVTPDEAGDHDAIELELTLNGETMQSASTADLIHSVPALVAHLSALMTLEPGDVVSTGTPAGVGSLRRPRVWLKPGDEVVVSSPTLGRLVTRFGERDA